MVFSDTSTSQGIVQDARFLVNADAGTYPTNDITRNINRYYAKAASIIIGSDGRWQFDDTNYTNLPIGTTDLVNGQQDYSIDDTFLTVTRVECKDSNGTFRELNPIDQNDVTGAMTEFLGSGGPLFYDKIANSFFLYPKPDYDMTAGLKVYFQRDVSYFTPSDTTKEPGFNPQFHRYLSLGAAYDFAVKNTLDNRKVLKQELLEMEAAIKDSYAKRGRDESVFVRPNKHIVSANFE